MFKYPWKLKASLIISAAIFIFSVILELFIDLNNFILPPYPYNLFILIAFCVAIVVLYILFKNNLFVQWLRSPHNAISVMLFYFILILLMGFIMQDKKSKIEFINILELNNILHSLVFFVFTLYILLILGLTIIHRIMPFNFKNFVFFLNHFGLFIIISFSFLSSSDLERLEMTIAEGQTEWRAVDKNNKIVEMPFAIELIDFKIDEFNPKIVLVDNKTKKIITEGENNLSLQDIAKNKLIQIKDWKIKVIKYFSDSFKIGDKYAFVNSEGSVPCAYLQIINNKLSINKTGWVASEGYFSGTDILKLNNDLSIAMTVPAPKKFSSKTKIYIKPENKNDETISIETNISVNSPIKIGSWNIYQLSYDENMGKWSKTSTFEIVKDNWIKFIYIGIFMLILGSLGLAWNGNKKD